MRSWLKAFSVYFVAASLIMLTLPVAAQLNSAVRGSLGGVVFDATGSVLPGADVVVTGPQGEHKVKTDTQGRYLIEDLVPGSYHRKSREHWLQNLRLTKEPDCRRRHLLIGCAPAGGRGIRYSDGGSWRGTD
ncbi:MAG: carboxypeptidase-like regulatory domain-containing protein [Terracidiphilus sp.]